MEQSEIYLNILREELIPAMGCTEPAAIALACAKAREALGATPERVQIAVSGNIMKNARSVVVPGTGGLRGVQAAAAAGALLCDPAHGLETLARMPSDAGARIAEYLRQGRVTVSIADCETAFYLDIDVFSGEDSARVCVRETHTGVTLIERNGAAVFSEDIAKKAQAACDRSALTVRGILEFAGGVPLGEIYDLFRRQIDCNTAIAERGLAQPYGAQVGRTLRTSYGEQTAILARAMAAAGADARMSGCDLPVVILSGSGNQGMTASLPVIVYARALGASEEALMRALCVASLVTIHQKTGIGCLSAFCGAVSAGCGAGAGVAYLHGGGYEAVCHTIVNALAIASGMVCDGAKPSCAAKIACAVDAGLLGYFMYREGREFCSGDGVLVKGVEGNIENIARIAKRGMRQTDREILDIMMECGGKDHE